MPEPPFSYCSNCGEREFADQLQVFLGRCQAFVGAARFSADERDSLRVLDSCVEALPHARTPAHYKLLKTVISEFLDACAKGSPEYDRLSVNDWDNDTTLAVTFRGACQTALLERVWTARTQNAQVHRALGEMRRCGTDASFNVSQAARACGISGPYLLRLCRMELGESFSDVLRHHRVALARRRLLSVDESIKQIAARVGYDSCSRFIRDFRHETGMTPRAFRRQQH